MNGTVTTSEQNKMVVMRRVEEIWHNPSLEAGLKAVDDLVAEDYVGHSPGMPDFYGREGFKAFVRSIRTAFPDLRFTADAIISEGDKVVAVYTARATHLGDFNGIP